MSAGTASRIRRPTCSTASSTAFPSSTATRSRASQAVAAAGCYPTAAILALKPLVDAGLVDPATSDRRRRLGRHRRGQGAQGRDRTSTRSTRISPPTACSPTATPPRWRWRWARRFLFTPHLAPMNRGILATCYGRPRPMAAVRPARSAARGLCRRAFRPCLGARALDQMDAGIERGPPHRAL